MIHTACSCGLKVQVKPELLGLAIRCPRCSRVFTVQKPAVAAVPVRPVAVVKVAPAAVPVRVAPSPRQFRGVLLAGVGVLLVALVTAGVLAIRAGRSLLASAPGSTAAASSADGSKPCIDPVFFDFPPDFPVTEEGRRKALAYLKTLADEPANSRAVDLVCPRDAARLPEVLRAAASRLEIDGQDEEWKNVPPVVKDPTGNVNVYHEGQPAAVPSAGMDLTDIRCLWTDEHLSLCFRTVGKPDTADVLYGLQIYDGSGEQIYSIILGREWCFLQHYRNGKFEKADPLPADQCRVYFGDVVEARVSRSVLRGLPDVFVALAVSFSDKHNRINFTSQFPVKAVRYQASTRIGWLLARYAEKTDLQRAGLVPLAVAVSETFILEHAEPGLRERIVQDGIALIEASRPIAGELTGVPFEEVLAWSNRGMNWGASGLYLDQRARITREAYEFMYASPALLAEVRQHLHRSGIGKEPTLRETVDAVDAWARGKNKYRWKPEVLAEWARTLPGGEEYAKLHRETLNDIQAGRHRVCTVNGQPIEFYMVGSPNVDWATYRTTGSYYGCCGDVAVVTMLAYKSLGIPDTCYFRKLGKEDAKIHTFAGYYDRYDRVWRTPRFQLPPPEDTRETTVLQWMLPGLTDRLPMFKVISLGEGHDLHVSQRSPYLRLSPSEMRKKLDEGFTHDEFCKLLYGQLSADAIPN